MQLYLLLNHKCNLNCNFCIRGKNNNTDIIDMEDLKEVLMNNDFSKYYLLLTGGEPSLHPNLSAIVDICSSHFKGVSVNTNGVESAWIDSIKNTSIHVQISIDGTQDFHDMIRGNGIISIYDRVVDTIKKLNLRGISYNISTTVGKTNLNSVKSMCRNMNKFEKMKYWKVSPQLPFGCANKEDTLDITQWNNLVDYLLCNSEVLLRVSKLFDFNLLDKYMLDNHNPEEKRFPKNNCGNVKYKVYVYPDFTVYPCTCLTDFPLGNLLKKTLQDIQNSEISRMFSQYTLNPESSCAKCKYISICNGGCIGMSYHFFGKLGMGDYRCPLISK